MQTGLNRVRIGKQVTVTELSLDGALRRRLEDFGLVPGTRVCCRYRSPGGQVTAVQCRGAVIALRTRDLADIQVRL